MPTLLEPVTELPRPQGRRTVADLVEELDGISPARTRMIPSPGTATENDVLRITETECLCELIDGTLVEKMMSYPESFLASLIIQILGSYVRKHRLGVVSSPDGPFA